jgi:hypothetical protein
MPLNFTTGERLAKFDHAYRIAPADKWHDTTFFDQACERAVTEFKAVGIVGPFNFSGGNVLCQEYPLNAAIAFIFVHWHNGREFYSHTLVHLSEAVISQFETVGRWERVAVQ